MSIRIDCYLNLNNYMLIYNTSCCTICVK